MDERTQALKDAVEGLGRDRAAVGQILEELHQEQQITPYDAQVTLLPGFVVRELANRELLLRKLHQEIESKFGNCAEHSHWAKKILDMIEEVVVEDAVETPEPKPV